MNEYWVYILRCSDGKYYTGITNNVEERLRQHQEGIDPTALPTNAVQSNSFINMHSEK